MLNQLAHRSSVPVETTDFRSRDVDHPGEDVQHLTFADAQYTMILCNHVLEHVPDDQQALKECARVLKDGGIAVFTVPGDFPKRETWTFDQPDSNGHYRHYGMDIVSKMEHAFQVVEAIELSSVAERNWRVRKNDFAFVCRQGVEHHKHIFADVASRKPGKA